MASQQSSRQRLALAICHFLNTSLSDGTLAADEKDSIDVAVSCIADSFKVDAADEQAVKSAVGTKSLLQIFSVYDNLKSNEGTSTSASASSSASASKPSSEKPSESQKKEAEGLKSKGNAAMAQKQYQQAITLYSQALDLDPTNAVFLSNRAAAHSAAKDHSSAKQDAEAAVAIDPSYTKAWSRLGLARFALGDAKGAMEAYAKGIEHEGNGGSEAMRKGFETAKRRVDELDGAADAGDNISSSRTAPQSSPSGMPDFGSIMSNPMFASMAQNLMSNPDLMSSLMSNPRLREMADSFGAGGAGGGGMPDIGSLMSDPNIADMARNLMGGANPGQDRNNNNNNSQP
ncbi:TPR Domain containing protein [Ophiocordyceps camponoti-floridani]|uniref:TPR Domain containing protein n=1 Tax=Ophiocordyceps camponoti-floridani TaxID=2030778 RepID=A0A8H4Q4C6_9HYPO|nr:TPR Domain containing protein [Ophiocordyceps camponoti-floridani]